MPTSFGMATSRPWMASRMAVSAETSATVIRTRAKSSMRKNCRIASDYSFPTETRLPCLPPRPGRRGKSRLYERKKSRTALLVPLIAARAAGPPLLVLHIGNIERLAPRALWLFDIADAFNIQYFGDGLVQNFARRFRILGVNLEFDSAEKIGNEPIHADHVVVHQVGLNPG